MLIGVCCGPSFRNHTLGYGDRGPKSYPWLRKMGQNQTLNNRIYHQINHFEAILHEIFKFGPVFVICFEKIVVYIALSDTRAKLLINQATPMHMAVTFNPYSIEISLLKIRFSDITDHLEIHVSYSEKSFKWNQVEGCYLPHCATDGLVPV